ncbi:hypothetical protein L6R49_25905 [Myxococcota bacterium]|nr:hypothetical protein [Myxococcota bacterium]
MSLVLTLALGCLGAAPSVTAEGRALRLGEESLPFPEGWRVALDPAHLRSGLPGVVAEAARGADRLALATFPLPAVAEPLRPLDLLLAIDPAVGAPASPGYRLGRAPRCGGVIERVLVGEDGRAAQQLAWRQRRLLVLVTAWSEGEALFPEAARAVVCARSPAP